MRPNYALAHNGLGNVRFTEGQFEQARAHYEEALRIRPDYATAQTNLARVAAAIDRR